jgi:hypothetical protein
MKYVLNPEHELRQLKTRLARSKKKLEKTMRDENPRDSGACKSQDMFFGLWLSGKTRLAIYFLLLFSTENLQELIFI